MQIDNSHPIVVFDGICNFCSQSVQAVIRADRNAVFRFASMQSPLGAQLMRRFGIDPSDAQTFLLVDGERSYMRSDAALEVARRLPFPWFCLSWLRAVPRFVRNPVYSVVARNRYKWFGKKDACFLPSPEERARFLGD